MVCIIGGDQIGYKEITVLVRGVISTRCNNAELNHPRLLNLEPQLSDAFLICPDWFLQHDQKKPQSN